MLHRLAKKAGTHLRNEWKFNLPYHPHFNGLIQAGVNPVKRHLVCVLGEQVLTYLLYTLLTSLCLNANLPKEDTDKAAFTQKIQRGQVNIIVIKKYQGKPAKSK